MKRETLTFLALATLASVSFGGSAFGQAPPQYPPPQYPPPQYLAPPQYPPRPPQQPAPTPPPGYPPGYPPPGYPPPQQPRPQQPPPQPVPAYPPQAPQTPPPGYPAPPPGYPPPQQPGYPPPQQPGYPPAPYPGAPQPGYPPGAYPGYGQPGYDPYGAPPALGDHTGFYLRLLGGPDYFRSGLSSGQARRTLSGLGFMLDFAAGGAPIENFVVYGNVTMMTLLSGTLSASGDIVGEIDSETAFTIGFGPGVAYYLMPLNLYFGGSIQMNFLRGDNVKNILGQAAELGFALNGDVGKEFFMTPDWGIGGALRLHFSRNGAGGINWTTFAIGLAFSATFN